ncbi:MAG TPA: SRPBCC family protein [Xanthobacteraceae bacterium]|jgi:carbon monoxide dehydrogenase subunit G|nr:SRPBCC family protein [Xanthobacteraceae bacterium]
MEFDNSFEIPLSPDQAWPVLMDVRGIAPCMPGAELTEIADAQNYKGKIAVRLGPVALVFAGKIQLEDIDNAKHSARVKAQGSDGKGRGAANVTATFRVEPRGAGSIVLIHTDLTLSGAVAQYGRGVGMIQATAAQIIQQFADNLRAQLAPQPASSAVSAPAGPAQTGVPPATPPAAKPISGFSLLLRVIFRQIAAWFGRRSDSL